MCLKYRFIGTRSSLYLYPEYKALIDTGPILCPQNLTYFYPIINIPSVAGSVLQRALSLTDSSTESWFVKIFSRRRPTSTAITGAFSHKID